MVLCLFSNVFHSTINDVGTCHLFKVSHTAADETMKHEYVTIYLCGWRFVTEVGIVDFVTLFKCKIKWRAVQHLRHLKGGERVVCRDIMLQTPVHNRAYSSEYSIDGVFR